MTYCYDDHAVHHIQTVALHNRLFQHCTGKHRFYPALSWLKNCGFINLNITETFRVVSACWAWMSWKVQLIRWKHLFCQRAVKMEVTSKPSLMAPSSGPQTLYMFTHHSSYSCLGFRSTCVEMLQTFLWLLLGFSANVWILACESWINLAGLYFHLLSQCPHKRIIHKSVL